MIKNSKYFFVIGGAIITIAIIIGLYWSFPLSSATSSNPTVTTATTGEVFTLEELADFLSIDKEKLEDIIEKDDVEKAGMEGIYDTYQFIPYAMISGEHRFLKKEIMEWLEYETHNNSQ